MEGKRGYIRLDQSELGMVPYLRRIYEFESGRVSGPGSFSRKLTDIWWTLDDLAAYLETDSAETRKFTDLIGRLRQHRQLMEIPGEEGQPNHYVTRVAETVRLLGHGYEYWQRGRPGIEAVRWLVEEKRVPARAISARTFISRVQEAVADASAGGSSGNLRLAIEHAVRAVATHFSPDDWTKARFSQFQLDAATEMVLAQFAGRRSWEKRHQVLTADVGAGKTAAFVIGVLVSAIEGRLSGGQARCHLLLYPRTALARDQYNTVSKMASLVEVATPSVHFEHMDYYSSRGQSVREGVKDVYGGGRAPPDLIITTLETLKRRLHNPYFVRRVAPTLNRVVLDEIHLVEGLTGTNIIRLMDRLRQAGGDRPLLWTGSSATVAVPDRHGGEVFGVPQDTIQVVDPALEDTTPVGLVHHVFLKPLGMLSTLGSLVNATSTLLHNRRRRIGDLGQAKGGIPRAIGFADNLDVLGRWNADFRENERTEHVTWKGRKHPRGQDSDGWGQLQREVPYALRFHDPLTRRIQAHPGRPTKSGQGRPYGKILRSTTVENPCMECRKGKRLTVGTCTPDELMELGRFVYRNPTKEKDSVSLFYIQNEAFQSDSDTEIGTLDLCPFLQSGTCFWFPEEDFEVNQIPGSRWFEWKHIGKSRIHSSKKKEIATDLSEELEELVFEAPVKEIYDVGWDKRKIGVDIVFASPSLEVGIDLQDVTEEVMFKSIRNVASYRQKAGRAGREEGSDTMIVTLLSSRALDFHYYRQPRKLVSIGRLDPVPLKSHNLTLLRSGLYLAVWDFLALNADLPEIIPRGWDSSAGESRFARQIRACLDGLGSLRKGVSDYLTGFSRGTASTEDVEGAVAQVESELLFLLTPTIGLLEDPRLTCIADIVANFIRPRHRIRVTLNPRLSDAFDELRGLEEDLDGKRPGLDPTALGLQPEFIAIDHMRKAGWERERLAEVVGKLSSQSVESRGARRRFKRFASGLKDILEVLDDIREIEPDADPLVWFFYLQLRSGFPETARGKAHYLSYLVEEMPIFKLRKSDSAFAMPATLFTNPYEPVVDVVQERAGKLRKRGQITVNEALFSFIPGTWTYRLGKEALKTKLGEAEHQEGGVLVAEYDQLLEAGHNFVEVERGIPGPPGSSDRIDVFMPTRLAVQHTPKYVEVDLSTLRVVDRDELSHAGANTTRVKVPREYLNHWIYVKPSPGEPIMVYDGSLEHLVLETSGGEVPGKKSRDRIKHPLMARAIESAYFHPHLEVVEYVHSVGRIYTSRAADGIDILFQRDGRGLGIGRQLVTEGVSFVLDPEVVNQALKEALEGLLNNARMWAPTSIKAFAAGIRNLKLEPGQNIDAFTLRDLISVLISSYDGRLDRCSVRGLGERLSSLLSDEGEFERRARDLADLRTRMFRKNIEDDVGQEKVDTVPTESLVKKLLSAGEALLPHLGKLEEGLELWLKTTLLNTFGLVAMQALQRLSGTPEGKIGYSPDLDSAEQGIYRIYLYDRDERGNGTCELLTRYMHILYLQRLSPRGNDTERLPSEDYLTVLEQELLQCTQFHVDINALAMFRERGREVENPRGIPELGYIVDYSREIEEIGRATWKQLGIAGPEDGWRLPLLSLTADAVAEQAGLQRDDVHRATGICWNGCPECVISDTMLLGPVVGADYVDKALLDYWFETARNGTEEYETVNAEKIAAGAGPKGIGIKSRVRVDIDNKTYRAVALPFTIGVLLSRDELTKSPQIVMRTSDIAGLRLRESGGVGEARGISIGMSRLVWYLLLTSSYLSSLERIPTNRRRVVMVFYDLRDVSFDETGLSEKMRETIEELRGVEESQRPLNRLSDILNWMSEKGFQIDICVDKGRLEQEGVRKLLESLNLAGRIKVFVKDLGLGIMHAKGLLTPIGAVDGSANLTYLGTTVNDEVVNFTPFGTTGYEDLKVAFEDIVRGAERWTP